MNAAEAYLKYTVHRKFSYALKKCWKRQEIVPLFKCQMCSTQSVLETCHSKQGSSSPAFSSSTLPPASCKQPKKPAQLLLSDNYSEIRHITALGLN